MAKKTKNKKSKVQKSRSGGRLDAQLRGYWKREKWGEFVTFYARHHAKLQKGFAGTVWDNVVFNALASVVFLEKDRSLFLLTLNTLDGIPEISEENKIIIELCHAYARACDGENVREELEKLPPGICAPFGLLRDTMMQIMEGGNDILDNYLSNPSKRSCKGEKSYSMAAKFSHHYQQKILAQGLCPASQTPFTQWKKLLQNFMDEEGVQSDPVYEDMVILIEMIRSSYRKYSSLAVPQNVITELRSNGFHFSDTLLVKQILAVFLAVGCNKWGAAWGKSVRTMLLFHYAEDFSMQEHLREQLRIFRAVAPPNDPDNEKEQFYSGPVFHALKSDDGLPWRETLLLDLFELDTLREMFASNIDISTFRTLENKPASMTDLQAKACWTYIDVLKMLETYAGGVDLTSGVAAFQINDILSFEFPGNAMWIEDVLPAFFPLKLPASVHAVLVGKIARTFVDGMEHPFVKQTFKGAPLPVGKDEMLSLANLITPDFDHKRLFTAWRKILLPADYTLLMQTYVEMLVKKCIYPDFYEGRMFKEDWSDMSDSFVEDLRQGVGPSFYLSGLLAMEVRNERDTLPASAEDARPFLDSLPEDTILYPLLLWMLEWENTSYSTVFICKIIKNLEPFLFTGEHWAELADALYAEDHDAVCVWLWQLWEEKGYLKKYRSMDFLQATECLDVFRPKARKVRGKKKKTANSLMEQALLDLLR